MRSFLNVPAAAAAAALAVAAVAAGTPAAAKAGGGGGGSDRPALKARVQEIAGKFQDAVVSVKVAIKQKMVLGGQQINAGDQQIEVTGTVIDPSGLIVISDYELDPTSLMYELLAGSMGGPQIQFQNEIGEVKIVLRDGKEVPGRVVLRDKDLDLAFVAPQEKGQKFVHVPVLEKGARAAKAPELFDDLLVLGRLGRSLDRTPTVTHSVVRAVVRKPRTFYVGSDPLGALTGGLGCPVFNGAGESLGILLMRRGPRASGEGSGLSALIGQMVPVVLPGEDVAELAAQAFAEAEKAREAAPQAPAATETGAGAGEKKPEPPAEPR